MELSPYDSVGMRVLLYHLLTTWIVLVTHAIHSLEAASLLMCKALRIAFFLLKRYYGMAKHKAIDGTQDIILTQQASHI